MNSIKKITTAMTILAFSFLLGSCEKDEHKPPTVAFKTGIGYTSADASVTQSQTLLVGITADKVEDDMISYNVSYSYDGASTTVTSQTFSLTGAEQQHYDKEVFITTRSQAGTEKWIFTITDKDGNVAQKQLVLTVL